MRADSDGWRQTCCLLVADGVPGGVCEDVQEDVQPLAVHEDCLEVVLASQAGERGGGAVLHDGIGAVHGVQDLVQHLARDLLLQPLKRLLHAVLGRLRSIDRRQLEA